MNASLREVPLYNYARRIFRPRFCLIVVLSITGFSVFAQKTWDGSVNANWNTANNWTPSGVPTSTDDVIIPDGITGTINVNTAAVCASLTMNGGGTANTLSISGTNSLDVSGAITINAGTGNNDHKVLAVNGGSLECGSITLVGTAAANRNTRLTVADGTITVFGSVSLGNANAQVTFTDAGTMTVGGDMTGGTFTASTGRVIYDGAAQNVGAYTYNNLTLRGSGNKTFATTPTVNGVLLMEATANAVVTTGVVTYGAGATLQYNKPAPYVATSEEWITPFNGSGGVVINSSTVTLNEDKALGNNAPLTINPGATLSTSGSNFDLTLQGNFVNSGTFTAGSSDIIIAGTATQSIAGFTTTGIVSMTKGSATATFTGNVSASALSMSGNGTLNLGAGLTHIISGDWTRTAGTLNGGTSTIRIGGSAIGAGGTFTPSNGTVEWNSAAAQTIAGVAYYNLTLSGGGVKTLQPATTTIGGNLTLSGTVQTTAAAGLDIGGSVVLGAGTIFSAGAFTHTVAGNWTNSGATFNNNGGTITLNGAAQAINGSNTFYNLNLDGSNTKTFNAPIFVENQLYINGGVVASLSTFLTHTTNTLSFGGAGQASGTWGGTGSSATNINTTFFAASSGIITVVARAATTYYTRQSGDWDANNTWSTITYNNATNYGTFPLAGDIVNIGGGNYTVTVDANAACAALNFQTGVDVALTVSLNTGISLDVSGLIDIPAGGNLFNPNTNTLAVGAGILNAPTIDFDGGSLFGGHRLTISTGTATITGDITGGTVLLSPAEFIFSGAGLLRVGGSFTEDATLTPSTGTVEYNGTGAQTISTFNGLSSYNNLTLSGASAKSVTGALDINGNFTLGAGTSFTAGAYDHTLAGNWVNNGTTFDNAASTFILDGASPQTIGGTSPTTFNNLTLTTSNKTFALSTTIEGITSITGVVVNLGSITTHSTRALFLGGTGQGPGTYGSTSSAATNQNNTYFTAGTTGIIDVTGRAYFSRQSGDWNNNNTWSTVTYGNATNSGTFPTAADVANIGGGDFNIAVNVNSTVYSLNFASGQNASPTVAIDPGITFNVTTIDLAGAGGGLFANEDNTLAVGQGILNVRTLAFSAGNSLAGAHVLSISSGTATVTGDVSQDFPDATITFTGSGLLRVAGNFLNSGNCTFTRSTGTVDYFGSTKAQTVGDFIYYNLILNNTFGTSPQLSLVDDTEARNALTMTSGTVNMNGNTFTLGSNGNASTLTRTASTTTNWMYGGTFRRYWLNATAVSSTVAPRYGLFPIGHSTASSYRPVEFNSTVNPNNGLVGVTHTNATTVTDLSPVYNDGGTDILRKSNAQFVVTSTVGAGTYNVSVTTTDLSPTGSINDIRLAVSNGASTVTTFGAHQTATGSVANPTATRTGVGFANLAGDWRITTTNLATPLPIVLKSFTAKLSNEQVELDWETSTEVNNALFTIEKTRDFETFYTVGEIDGNGNSKTASTYSLVDPFPFYGRSYYRLKQTDFDGKFTYSKPVMIYYQGSELPGLTVFPNPAKGSSVRIVVTNVKDVNEVPVRIFNQQGQLVFETSLYNVGEGNAQVDLPLGQHLSKGIYIVKAGPTLSLTRKLFIE